jgi:hypothetical protein
MADSKIPVMVDEKFPEDISEEVMIGDASTIYIDPEKEKACLRKFDKFFMPQAFAFLVLNYLDRSNVSIFNVHPVSLLLMTCIAWKCRYFRLQHRVETQGKRIRKHQYPLLCILCPVRDPLGHGRQALRP